MNWKSSSSIATLLAVVLLNLPAKRLAVSAPIPPWPQSEQHDPPQLSGRFDVGAFGATGDGKADDTAAIQAAFDACWHAGRAAGHGRNYGGVVAFPESRWYVISSTIYTHNGCGMEGNTSAQNPTAVFWNGPAAGAVVFPSSFTVAANTTPYQPAYSPAPSETAPFTITFPVVNSITVNAWVLIAGFRSPAGIPINHTVTQVVAASPQSFTVTVPFKLAAVGTFADSGSVTTINVMFASDLHSRYFEEIRDMEFRNMRGIPRENWAGVDFYFGSRVDTGSRIWSVWAERPLYFGYYFSKGGIDVDFDKGWRSDEPGMAGIYWRVDGGDNFGIANGTVSTDSGAGVMLDNSGCSQGNLVRFSARNMGMEVEDKGLAPGMGMFMLLDCPTDMFPVQFAIDMENTRTAADKGSVNYTTLVMSPPNDLALTLNIVNGVFPNGRPPNTTRRWVGIPALTRQDAGGQQGYIPSLTYAPSLTSAGHMTANLDDGRAMSQCIGDCNIGQLWQYGVQASALLYADPSFSGLPNGTTLFAGQLIASPDAWRSGDAGHLAISVIHQAGTTGIPNRGATRCRAMPHAAQLICDSAADLSVGQHINIGPLQNAIIFRIDATIADAVVVSLDRSAGALPSAVVLSYSAPDVGPPMQLRSEAGPRAAQDAHSASRETRTVHAYCTGTAAPSSTLTLFGAGATVSTCTAQAGRDDRAQLLMNDGGTVRDLAVRCAHSGVDGKSGAFRIWDLPSGTEMRSADSGRDTGVWVLYGTSPANTTIFDSTHSFSYSKGDLLRLQFTTRSNETLADCEASFSY